MLLFSFILGLGKFYFLFFLGIVMYDKDFETKKDNLNVKKLNHNMCKAISSCGLLSDIWISPRGICPVTISRLVGINV